MSFLRGVIYKVLVVVMLCVASAFVCSCSRKDEVRHRMLVVHSYFNENEEYAANMQKYYQECMDEHDVQMEVRNVFLRKPFVIDEEGMRILHDSLTALQTEGWLPDVVVLHGDDALRLYLPEMMKIKQFGETPTVFAGVYYSHTMLAEPQYCKLPVTGYRDSLYVHENMAFLTELFPTNNSCMIEMDSLPADNYAREILHQALSDTTRYIDNCDFHLSEQESMRLLLGGKEKRNIIFPISVANPNSNLPPIEGLSEKEMMLKNREYIRISFHNSKYFKQMQVSYTPFSNSVIDQSRVPQLSMIGTQFLMSHPTRILGGYFATEQSQVNDAMAYALRILDGIPPMALPMKMHTPDYVMDWNAMNQLGLKVRDFNDRAKILNVTMSARNPEAFDLMRVGLFLLCSILVVLIIFSFVWLVYTHRRKITDYQMRQVEYLIGGQRGAMWSFQSGEFQLSRKMMAVFQTPMDRIGIDGLLMLIHPDDRPLARKLVKFDYPEGHYTQRLRFCHFNDPVYHTYVFDYSLNSMSHLHNRVEGLVTRIDDLVEEEQHLQSVLQAAEETRLKEAFLANMTHDIRSPLSTIVSFADMLATDGLSLPAEDRKVFVDQIEQSTNVMLTLLSDVVDVSRMQMGEYRFIKSVQSVAKIVEQAFVANEVLVPSHLTLNRQYGEDATINIDPSRLVQVLNNFLSNAIKNTPAGHITLGWELRDGWVDIFVEDTGVGISEEMQGTIFEKFTKYDGQSGAGLGLNICKTIVEKQGGHISLRSQVGVGSRFTASFPTEKG